MNSLNLKKHINIDKKKKDSILLLAMVSVLMLTLLLSLIISVSAQEDLKRSIQIINPRPDFSLSLRLDKGTGATYAPGESIRVSFRSSRNAYVAIFSYDSFGNITLLFPNQNQKDHFVEANKQYNIDGIVDIGSESGSEYIQGFATSEPVIITRTLERLIDKELFPKIDERMDRFTQRIRGILTGLPSQRWVSSDILHYQVVDRRGETGKLRLDSSPEGAEVYLNDRYAGRTPLLMDQIRAGEYVARVELPGYQVWTRTILINPDRTAIVQANLTSLQRYGSISVRSNENNAEIYLDGQYKGLTEKNRSVLLEQIPEGFHDIRVNLGGYIDWSQRVEVKPNQRVQLTVNLEKIKRTASIEIISDISNARIYLDGKYLKTTTANKSVTIDNIKEGSYELRITKDDYQDYVTMVNLVSGQIYHINVTMRPIIREGAISINCNESSAKVFINGKQMITTTANQVKTITGLKEGSYEVTVIKDGFRTWIDELWVYPGETTSAYVNLSKISR